MDKSSTESSPEGSGSFSAIWMYRNMALAASSGAEEYENPQKIQISTKHGRMIIVDQSMDACFHRNLKKFHAPDH